MDELALRTLLNSLEASRSSLHGLLHIFTWFVVVGLGFDLFVVIKEFRDDWGEFRYGEIHPYENHLPKRPSASLLILALLGTALIVIGVAGELYVDVQAGKIETQIREANDKLLGLIIQEAGDAAQSAKIAHDEADAVKGIADEARADAKDALAKAQAAQRELAHAEADAAKAQAAASRALSTADKAESHIAEAMKRADALTAKLERLTTPRRVTHSARIVAPLKVFKGTEYVFIGTCGDQECFDLVSDIDELLKLAEWRRVKGPPMRIGIPQVRIHDDKDFAVDLSVSTGIGISIETPNALESVKLPDDQQTEHIRAAIALNQVLALNVSPSENTGRAVGVATGTSTTVRIDVGRKPL